MKYRDKLIYCLGFCGIFDGNRNNDLMKRDGDLYIRGGK